MSVLCRENAMSVGPCVFNFVAGLPGRSFERGGAKGVGWGGCGRGERVGVALSGSGLALSPWSPTGATAWQCIDASGVQSFVGDQLDI